MDAAPIPREARVRFMIDHFGLDGADAPTTSVRSPGAAAPGAGTGKQPSARALRSGGPMRSAGSRPERIGIPMPLRMPGGVGLQAADCP